ncbi:MAG: thioredoxin-dependent thiol peroxidase [Hyphomonadaceae bacterium]|nr:thioredoxin-dependent thiol peroxidase [Hyphomonadaceae bacterium]
MAKELKPGDPAPNFDLPTAGGGRVSLSTLKGKRAVLYFYPKDDTPGCTQEALNFTENAKAFAAAKVMVIGVSRDSVEKHDKFAAKHGLSVILAADEDGEVCERYGVWKEKKLYGRTFMGIERSTFLIDSKGAIARVWRKVRVPRHVDEVLKEVNAKPGK